MNNQLELNWHGGILWTQIPWKNRMLSCCTFILCLHLSAQAWHVWKSYNWALLKALSKNLSSHTWFRHELWFSPTLCDLCCLFYHHSFYKHHFMILWSFLGRSLLLSWAFGREHCYKLFCTRYDFMISLLFNAVSTLILCKHTCNQTHVLHLTWSYCTNMNHTQLPLQQPLSGIWPTMVDFAEGTPVKPAHANPEYIKHKSAMIICSDHNMQACQKYLATKISTPSSLHTLSYVWPCWVSNGGFRMF